MKNEIDLNEFLQISQEKIKEQEVLSDLIFQPTVEADYGKYKGVKSAYSFIIQNIKHEGEIYVFRENGITMCIALQEAIEDHKENRQGFETIQTSLIL